MHPRGHAEVWGTYGPGASHLLQVRGATYLSDKIKVEADSALMKLAHVEVLRMAHTSASRGPMAQKERSWFYRTRAQLPAFGLGKSAAFCAPCVPFAN